MKLDTVKMCANCGKPFTPDVRTERKQRYCDRYGCLMERQRERQKAYRMRRKEDLEWRMKQAHFTAESKKRRNELEDAAARSSVGREMRRKTETSTTRAILAGIAAIVGKAYRHDELLAFLAKMETKGRRLLGSCLNS